MKKAIQLTILKRAAWTLLLALAAQNLVAQSWTQRGADIDGESAGNQSGCAVDLSSDGSTLAIGARYNAGGGTNRGQVRVYTWNSSTSSWAQKGADIDGATNYSDFGFKLSLSADGNILAVGGPNHAGGGSSRGHVRIFNWNSGSSSWVQRGSDIFGEADDDFSGSSVSLSAIGNTVVIGAPNNADNGTNSGHVRIYDWNTGTSAWVQRGSDINGEAAEDFSGSAVKLSSDANTVAIGAPNNDGNGVNSGQVRIYDWNTGTSAWVQRGLDINGEAGGDFSGTAVSLSASGNTVAIGAHWNDGSGNNCGHVRIYDWNTGTSAWVQRGTDINGEAAWDEFGNSLALSTNGNTIIIGARYNEGGGNYPGHARIYDWNSSSNTWAQRGSDLDGEAAADEFGTSVAISSDGNIIAIGAPLNDDNGGNSGHVRVYSYPVTPTCATGTVTWDGGGSDERFFTKENWVGDLCPCAGADLIFNGTGTNTKHCILDSSLTLGAITLRGSYNGRFRVEKTGVVLTADTLHTSGPSIVLNPETGAANIDYVFVWDNAFLTCGSNAGINVNRFNVGAAGYVSFRSRTSANIDNLNVARFAQVKAPENGHIYLTGNLQIANRTTFDGNGATLHFTGTTNQTVDVANASQIATIPLVVNKDSGAVVLQRNLNINKLTLTNGNINTGINKLTLTTTGGLTGGDSSSYINGRLSIEHNSAWTGSKMLFPVGKGGKYRPITLHNASSTNAWDVEFVDANPFSLPSSYSPFTTISGDGYWTANRTAGGGGNSGDATFFEISDAGKGSWNNNDLRVATRINGSLNWEDLGGIYTSNAIISSDSTKFYNEGFMLALGYDDGITAPGELVDGEWLSGRELQTAKNTTATRNRTAGTITFRTFPNPVTETLHIAINGTDAGSITLSDLSGKVLGVFSSDTRSINLQAYAPGMYFATFSNGNVRITQCVIRN